MTKKKNPGRAAAAVAVAATLASCTPVAQEREITINLPGILSGPISKAASDVLAATAPTQLPALVLQSRSVPERRYTVTPGVPATVALDTYSVSGEYAPNEEGRIFGASVFATPPFSVGGEITVTEGQSDYPVSAAYKCIALVLDRSVCSTYKVTGYAGAPVDLLTFGQGGFAVAYVRGGWTFPGLRLTAVPADPAQYESASYELFTDAQYANGALVVEDGKWYSFGPRGVQTTEGGINLGLPSWEDGNEQ